MTTAEMVSYLKLMQGFEDFADADVLTVLNLTYRTLNSSQLWEYLTKRSTVATVASQENLGLTDLRTVRAIRNLTSDTELDPLDQEQVVKSLYDLTVGKPYAYYVSHVHTTNARDVFLRSVPDGVYNLYVVYYRIPSALALGDAESAIAVPPAHHEVLVNGAAYRLYALNDDSQQAAQYKAMYDQGVMALQGDDGLYQVDRMAVADDLFADEEID